jgi:TetR/AcrR family transcriptional regulator
MDLFARSRSGGATIQEVADAAGTHKTTLLYHFPSKDILYEAVLERALEPVIEMMEGFLATEFTPDRLGWYLDELHRFLRDNPSIPRLLMRELDYGERYADHFVRLFTPAEKRLAEAEKAGVITRVEPVFFVHDLHVQIMTYFCHGPLLERLMGTDPYSVDAMILRRQYLIDQIVRQWRPDKSRTVKAAPENGQTKRRAG